MNWTAPTQEFAGQFNAYAIKCANRPLDVSTASDVEETSWWQVYSDTVTPTPAVTPPATSANVTFRTGEERHCMVRAYNTAAPNVLSPIVSSVSADYGFRTAAVNVAGGEDSYGMGRTITRIGDVNGDNISDLLIGGVGRAYLYLGGTTLSATPTTTFESADPFEPLNAFGTRTAGLGDINGDMLNDFAISWPEFGVVYVYFGRGTSTWPATVTVTDPAACPADVCFAGTEDFEYLGSAIAPLGNFAGDANAINDFAIGSPLRNTGAGTSGPGGTDELGGRLYVIVGRDFTTGLTRQASGFFELRIALPDDNPLGFQVDATGESGTPAISQLGSGIVGVGDVAAADGASSAGAPADLLVSALGGTAPSRLLSLSGRAHPTGTGLAVIAPTDLVQVDQGTAQTFASGLTVYRNFFDAAYVDVGVGVAPGDQFFVYRGAADPANRYQQSSRIAIRGPGGQFANSGAGASSTFNPSIPISDQYPQYGDLDAMAGRTGDGRDDLPFGSLESEPAGTAGPLFMFYSSVVTARITMIPQTEITFEYASRINPAPRPGVSPRTAQMVGDINGDGRADIVMGESQEPPVNPDPNNTIDTSGLAGGFTILY
jgi:hypothetical protein